MSDLLQHAGDLFSSLEISFARSIARLADDGSPELSLAAAATLRAVGRGDLCYALGDPLVDVGATDDASALEDTPEPDSCDLPAPDVWREALRHSPAVEAASGYGRPTSTRPLVLDPEGRLYLRRSFATQAAIAEAIRSRLAATHPVDEPTLEAGLARLFPKSTELDLQRSAAALAVRLGLSLIAGGPGTGKTTTVAKVLALLIEQRLAADLPAPRFALAAPTGKAASRLAQAISHARSALDVSEEVRGHIPSSARTLHRLLGLAPAMRRRLPEGRLSHEVVIVDEASMVDIGLMDELLRALPPHARLVLLGDPSQLASVSEGAVFADLCAAPAGTDLARAQVRLLEGHRYVAGSDLHLFAEAIRQGDTAGALQALHEGSCLALVDPLPRRGLSSEFLDLVVRGYGAFLAADDPRTRLESFERFRILCAHRRGPFGAPEISRKIEHALLEGGHLPSHPAAGASIEPILIVRNAPALGLFNGDVGYIDRTGVPTAHFPGEVQGVRSFAPSRLPAHESAWAMTVHKSQGSEVDSVALVLPATRSAVCTRELVYTAVTRARSRVAVFSDPGVLRFAIARRAERRSGLRDALADAPLS